MTENHYFNVQLKRIKKLLPMVCCIAAAFSLAVILVCAFIIQDSAAFKDTKKYSVGLVGTRQDSYLSMGLNLLNELDDIQYMLDMKEYDTQEEANAAMKRGDITAFAVIPTDFVDSINCFRNDSQIKYYSGSGQKGLTEVLMDEVSDIASDIIISSEAGLFTLQDIMDEMDISNEAYWSNVNTLFMEIISSIFKRSNLTNVNNLGMSEGLSTFSYYFIAFSVFYLLLISFANISFHIGQTFEFKKMICALGISQRQQVLSEFGALLLNNVCCFLIFESFFFVLIQTGYIEVLEFADSSLKGIATFAGGFLLIVVLITAMEMFLYEVISGLINKIIIIFLTYISFAYVSGFFYPKEILPEGVEIVGECLPTGIAFQYQKGVIQGRFSFFYAGLCLLYTFLFIIGTIYFRKRNILKGGGR